MASLVNLPRTPNLVSILRACADWRVIAGLAAVGVAVAVFAPNLGAAAVPLLIVAVCPVSMVLMMRAMGSHPSAPNPPEHRQPAQLRERLAASRLEQEHLEQELARLEAPARVHTAGARGHALAADVRTGPN